MVHVAFSYSYPAVLEKDEAGRVLVLFPAFPEAATDGVDEAEACAEAADCLSEALAGRIANGEEIPPGSWPLPGQHLVSPDPTIALKAALHMAMYRRTITVADLAELLQIDWHQAARLVDPKRSSKLTRLATALRALGCEIAISVAEDARTGSGAEVEQQALGEKWDRLQSGGNRPAGGPASSVRRPKRRDVTSAG
jgi:antitoxin HicB